MKADSAFGVIRWRVLAMTIIVGLAPIAALAQDAPFAAEAPVVGTAALPRDLSPWGMFMSADNVVKAVMIGLAFASVVTWTVWLAKSIELLAVKRATRKALQAIAQSRSLGEALDQVGGGNNVVVRLLEAAQAEVQLSGEASDKDGIKERTASRLERIEAAYGRRITRGTNILATIGATAPFVGLFGTVWGIMNSFIGISKAQTTNLACRAGHRRSASRDSAGTGRGHSGCRHLQRIRPLDYRLPGAAGGRFRRGLAAGEPRSRPAGIAPDRPARGRRGVTS